MLTYDVYYARRDIGTKGNEVARINLLDGLILNYWVLLGLSLITKVNVLSNRSECECEHGNHLIL